MFYEITAVIIVFLLIIISLIIYIIFSSSDSKVSGSATVSVPEANNKVCLSIDDYNVLLDKAKHNKPVERDETVIRDRKVLNDPLYPPLNRSDNKTHAELANNIANK
jgi:hypothetical protein